MMVEYPPEVRKLTLETAPWIEFDPDKFRCYIREDAPQSIKEKYKKLQDILDKVYAPFEY